MALFEKLQIYPSKKRSEEKQKFVFKILLKKLKERFKQEQSYINDKDFYVYYFEKVARNQKLEIDQFFDPLNSRIRKRTLGNSYFNLIFKSQKFKKDVK